MKGSSVTLLLALSAGFGTALPYSPDPAAALDPEDFVYREGLRLYDKSGQHYLTGLNYWACKI